MGGRVWPLWALAGMGRRDLLRAPVPARVAPDPAWAWTKPRCAVGGLALPPVTQRPRPTGIRALAAKARGRAQASRSRRGSSPGPSQVENVLLRRAGGRSGPQARAPLKP